MGYYFNHRFDIFIFNFCYIFYLAFLTRFCFVSCNFSGLPSARHLRSASDYIDSHTTQTSTCHHGLHFPCSISLITFTPAANYTHYRMMSPEVAANAPGTPEVVLLAAVLPQAMVTSVASSEVAVYAAEHPEAKVLASAPCARW